MKIVFIPKTGKYDYSVPKAYRRITLINFLFKSMERVFLSERAIALPLLNQHARTRGLGTETFTDLVKVRSTEGKSHSSSASNALGLSTE